jgi:release factor glutamine methyltransferase
MILKQALQEATQILEEVKITSARLDAEVILMFVLDQSKEFIFSEPEYELTDFQEKRFFKLIDKRTEDCPVAYITKTKSFFNLDFSVNQNVLIPRPDTEMIVTEALELLKNENLKSVIEIGTGSGAIAISIAKNSPETSVTATDISDRALNVSKKNAKANQVSIKLIKGNLLQPVKNQPTDILVANLPYLEVAYKDELDQDNTKVLKFEPEIALYSGQDGLDAYRQFFTEAGQLKSKPKYILIEHDPEQTEALEIIIKKNLPNSRLTTLKNLCGVDRITKIKV